MLQNGENIVIAKKSILLKPVKGKYALLNSRKDETEGLRLKVASFNIENVDIIFIKKEGLRLLEKQIAKSIREEIY